MLEGRVAIVTGGGRGIGRAHALRLAAYGARVVVNDAGVAADGGTTDETPADAVVVAIRAAGGEAVAQRGDIADLAVGEALVGLALATWGRLDIVVNNAGIGRPRMLFNMSEDEWDDVVRVHLKGTFSVSRAACRWWRAQAKAGAAVDARLLNTSSGLLVAGGAGQSNYVAAKGGVAAFTEAVASEMAPYGVTANAIMPAARTRLSAAGWRMQRAAAAFDDTDPTPVAELVCYLASPAAAAISGQTFHVRGGRIEHVTGWQFGAALERADRGFTAAELAIELPKLVTGGPKPAARPPQGWAGR